MSRRRGRFTRALGEFKRAGEGYIEPSSQRLPRAQERVQWPESGPELQDELLRSPGPGRTVYLQFDAPPRVDLPRQVPKQIALQAPAGAFLCAQRQIRKEVLFAKSVAGKRGGSPGPYRRNWKSERSC